jgi:hypothetical protein
MKFFFFGSWFVYEFVGGTILSDLRALMHTRIAPTPAIRSFEQDIFETVSQTLISRYELLNCR